MQEAKPKRKPKGTRAEQSWVSYSPVNQALPVSVPCQWFIEVKKRFR